MLLLLLECQFFSSFELLLLVIGNWRSIDDLLCSESTLWVGIFKLFWDDLFNNSLGIDSFKASSIVFSESLF